MSPPQETEQRRNSSPPPEEMDESSFFTMLSSLLRVYNSLDSTLSLSASPPAPPYPSSSSSLLATSSTAPLVFLASITALLSHKMKTCGSAKDPEESSALSISAFRALSTEHIWSLEAPLRDEQWRSQYGLSHPVFTTIVEKLKPHITASSISLPPDYVIAIVLSRLAHGSSAKTLSERYRLTPYLISKITNMVTRLLATKMYPEFVKIPVSKRRLNETTQAFEELTSLPNMCAAIDSTPIKLQRSGNHEEEDYVYKCKYGFDATLLQVVADHKKVFLDVCVKAGGGSDDASHFRDSVIYNRLISADVAWDKVVGVRGQHVRPYIVGDWCYPLLSFLMTPFSATAGGTAAQNLFDGMLMKGRAVVGEAIGLLKGRWRILQNLNVGINHAPQTIVACCVLHNLCQIAREPEPPIWREPDEIGPPPRVLESEKSFHYFGDGLRQALADDLHQRLSTS